MKDILNEKKLSVIFLSREELAFVKLHVELKYCVQIVHYQKKLLNLIVSGVKMTKKLKTNIQHDANRFYGKFGGSFVPEELQNQTINIEKNI